MVGIIHTKSKVRVDNTLEEEGDRGPGLSVLGAAVFNQDILVGYLNGNDTKSLNFIQDKIVGGVITFPTPAVEGKVKANPVKGGLSSVFTVNSKTKNQVEVVDGNIILKTKVKLKANIGEITGDIDISKEENIIKIEEACSKAIEEGVKRAVEKIQKEFKLDIFGFGAVFHRKYPKQWKDIKKDWDQLFSEADFEIEVETHIVRTGLISTPLSKRRMD